MPLYRDYAHALSVASSLTPKITVEGRLRLEKAMRHSQKYISSEKEKRFFLAQKIKESLWDIPEAVEKGFHAYLKEYIADFDTYQEYLKHNPEE